MTGLILAGLLVLLCPECELRSLLGDAESELGLRGGGRRPGRRAGLDRHRGRAWGEAADLRPGELPATPQNGHAEIVASHYEAASASGKRAAKGGLTYAGREYQKHMGPNQLPVVPGKEFDSAGQAMLDRILTDPYADYQPVTTGGFAGGFRLVGNEVVNGRFIGATFDSSGEFRYFGVY
ncbi:hypothetical protein ACGFMK_00075 [Amycolatopsis sp. NPDC049252]|uniref:hypothetical protein n=1 Tax=Amycolatopsis sp. NPDC049252 TaxID=3363933 RepID=UPI00371A300E